MAEWRQTVLSAARRVGAEPALRRVQYALEGSTMRRDRRDGDHLKVLLAAVLAPDSDCIDVGANLGVVLREMMRCAPQGRFVAFEPLPELAARLRDEFPRADVRNAALSDHRGEATFYRAPQAASQSSLSSRSHAGEPLEPLTVELVDLDSALPGDFAPALVKIDVEGAEEQVLRGARETLERHKPVVVLEHGDRAGRFGTTSDTIHELLTGAGLRVYDMDGNGPLSRAAFVASVEGGDIWTYVARA
jgi:FkbM family methyltransferase